MGITGEDYDENSKGAYEKFVKDLKDRTNGLTDCRYAVFDFKFTCNRPGAGNSKMDKLVFIQVRKPELVLCVLSLNETDSFNFFSVHWLII